MAKFKQSQEPAGGSTQQLFGAQSVLPNPFRYFLLGLPVITVMVAVMAGAGYYTMSDRSPYTTEPFSLGRVLCMKDGVAKSTKPFAPTTSNMWKNAREAMRKNPNATMIHADPDIFLIDNLLSDEECDRMMALLKKRKEEATAIEPLWCFAPGKYGDLRPQGAIRNLDGEGAGNDCFKDQKAGRNLAALHGRAVSRSIMVVRAESGITDLVGQRVEEQAGLDEDHAFHTQLLEYSTKELYEAHVDCGATKNDRAGTSLIYLSDVKEGGETGFPELVSRLSKSTMQL
jgi:hypothetical protein